MIYTLLLYNTINKAPDMYNTFLSGYHHTQSTHN